MDRPPLEVADLVRAAGGAFIERSRKWICWKHVKVLLAIARCRTAALSGHLDECTRCGHRAISYNSCRNRHCPKCQAGARSRWLAARQKELLPTRYVHVVFTLPRHLAPLVLQNKKVIYDLLFRTRAETLLEVARDPQHLGAEIGFFSVLRTWSQKLELHPHVHCVVPAGGLSADRTRWSKPRYAFFLPVEVLGRVFRGKFHEALKRAFQDGQLNFHGDLQLVAQPKTFSAWLRPLFRNDFCLDTSARWKLRFSALWIGVRLRVTLVPMQFSNDEQQPVLPALVVPTCLDRFPLLFVHFLCRSIFGLLLLVGFFLPRSIAGPRKIIIDTDPGTDDAMAIMLALNSPELEVRAITVVPGNVTAAQGLDNALRLISLANRCDIPVAAGAQHPLFQKLITAEFWHGRNGLANIDLPPSKCKVDARWGPDLIIELVHASPHEITLVPVGPLTNIALAIQKDPSIVPLVKEVILMGGSISGGNATAAAEANIYGDPEAAQIVFQAGWPLTMVGLDVGDKTLLSRKYLAQLGKTHGPVNDFVYQVAEFLIKLGEQFGDSGTPMYDPLAVGVAIDPSIVKAPLMHVDVETRGEFTRGQTVANRRNEFEKNVLHHFPSGDRYVIEGLEKVEPNAKVCTEVNAEKFLELFVSRIQGK